MQKTQVCQIGGRCDACDAGTWLAAMDGMKGLCKGIKQTGRDLLKTCLAYSDLVGTR